MRVAARFKEDTCICKLLGTKSWRLASLLPYGQNCGGIESKEAFFLAAPAESRATAHKSR